jgi:hypothetical protein
MPEDKPPEDEGSILQQLGEAKAREREAESRQRVRNQYQAYLELVWKKPDNCPICDSTAWNLGDLVDVPLRSLPSSLLDLIPQPRTAYVYAPVTCLYCGFTMFFHTGVLDVRATEEVKAVPPLRIPKDKT